MTTTPDHELALVRQATDDARDAHILATVAKMRAVLDELEAAIHGKPRVVVYSQQALQFERQRGTPGSAVTFDEWLESQPKEEKGGGEQHPIFDELLAWRTKAIKIWEADHEAFTDNEGECIKHCVTWLNPEHLPWHVWHRPK